MCDHEGAREILMEILGTDLRCIDAHVHLANMVFDRSPELAMVHYEVGIKIGELSLPPGFDGLLTWGRLYNRPFLRGRCRPRAARLVAFQVEVAHQERECVHLFLACSCSA